ncbi:S1 family peptidase [Roseateles koreensis]|uniref:Serine protease n=1 Tax=Roseateles koreensis TaxID=2987526 RepID=A0ABT5KRQ1_9BURK|nr:serine protease [Roseateles koreensis]MDC8785532.1 serine protease [Roseateles koreensis]
MTRRILTLMLVWALTAVALLPQGARALEPVRPPPPVPAPIPAPISAGVAANEAVADTPATVSATARRVYDASRAQLLQIRTMLKDQDSQASVGSGFLVSDEGHVLTNYHVVSQVALEPGRYRLRFATTDGHEGALELLDFDVRRDLALLRAVPGVSTNSGNPLKGRGLLKFRPAGRPLEKGDRIYAMGNPHDVAFAVVEGNYNGLVERSFDGLIYYSGSINAGMSGGPVVDEAGRVVGVNVSAMFFAQQMSFLVPAEYAAALLERSRNAKPITAPAWPRLREQLMRYQDELSTRFLAQPWRIEAPSTNARYQLPVPQELFMRCWGRGSPADAKGLEFQRSQCRMEHALFINGNLQTGFLSMSHEVYDGRKLGALRFARQYSASFRNEQFGAEDKDHTAPFCKEDFVTRNGLPLRAVVCLRAYRKLPGLHDLSVLAVTTDASVEGALGRFDANGVSFENAMKLSKHYLEGFAWTHQP